MRTLLALDVGNTRVKVGVFIDGRLTARLHVDTDLAHDVDALVKQLKGTFQNVVSVDACLIASVVKGLHVPLSQAIQDVWDVLPIVVNTEHDLGIRVAVPKPEWVGIDRLLEASEAFRIVKSGVVVAAFGSAITVDLVTGDGVFEGGTILPGLQTGLHALHLETSLLPDLKPEVPHTVLGKDTASCMQAGVVYGAAGAVDRIFKELCIIAGKPLPLVLTGGDVRSVAPLLHTQHQIEEDLVLRALVALDKRLQ